MNLEKIEGLVKIIEESSLSEFTYEEGDVKITMSKLDHPKGPHPGGPAPMPMPYPVPMMQPMSGAMPMEGMAGAAPAAAPEAKKEEEEPLFITSPIVGTFYSAPAPDAPAFVKVGDQVKNGATVCILEAMKLMNEIQCEYDCQIEAVLVSNEQKVEYGQPLFRVKRL
ncbi:MAG: acetyl-CoA carboxylase biotin carboxyl carrier protein [Lachnospiraceae bacterium]|nr:acetyl-CoA carboxylase biotin carboxyl carrier protein [Lachnospiraceae bacterium]